MHCADGHAHRLLALVRFEDVVVGRCTCGWLTRAGSAEDAFDYHDRHLAHSS